MVPLGYVIASIVLASAVVLALVIVGALWFAVSATRPELLDGDGSSDEGST